MKPTLRRPRLKRVYVVVRDPRTNRTLSMTVYDVEVPDAMKIVRGAFEKAATRQDQ